MKKIYAPWTNTQVEGLCKYQTAGFVHEYTCGSGIHDTVALIPTLDGWVCHICPYRQNWAHESHSKF